MEYLRVILAAVGAFAFGEVWYTTLSKPWIAAAGITVGAAGRREFGGRLHHHGADPDAVLSAGPSKKWRAPTPSEPSTTPRAPRAPHVI